MNQAIPGQTIYQIVGREEFDFTNKKTGERQRCIHYHALHQIALERGVGFSTFNFFRNPSNDFNPKCHVGGFYHIFFNQSGFIENVMEIAKPDKWN